ncbi:manganese efflux pump [Filibacter tadaridae]|uniref:Manganese efflux pump MntP n=1 Tax=Filibacter tadaridae TaxID=2483811 RepID=A0A3P5WLJ6_9BACL|nr:manganese efflux pump [Filibacter tadaridae]VDC19415.1 manganese efflux pump MntP [Filibacter tadaridae]
MIELFAAVVTSIDIIIVFMFLRIKKGKLVLALWTAMFNMIFPLLGFLAGELSAQIFTAWSTILSGLLLALIGIHMLLQTDEDNSSIGRMPPFLIALAVCMDTFSVSVSFGMLHMNKILFILASGFFSFTLGYGTLLFKRKVRMASGKGLRIFAGVALLAMGILSFVR